MAKRSFKGALGASLEKEESAVHERFARADNLLKPDDAPKKSRVKRPAKTASKKKVPVVATEKVVRDTFSFPPSDYKLIKEVRLRLAKKGRITSKSELMRAALHQLNELSDAEALASVEQLIKVKPGRKAE